MAAEEKEDKDTQEVIADQENEVVMKMKKK